MTRPRGGRSLYEAAHKLDEDIYEDSAPRTPKAERRRSLNESAHKLGHWPVLAAPTPETAKPSSALQAADDDQRDVVANAGSAVLALGALGIVYGDIGTSPLYTEQVIFTAHRAAARTTVAGVYGVASLIFWALMIVVSIKYAGFIMRAHNRGDGGIMALTALIPPQGGASGRPALRISWCRSRSGSCSDCLRSSGSAPAPWAGCSGRSF
jgi:hypothetical protein